MSEGITYTLPGVLKQLDRTGEVPGTLLLIEEVQEKAPDPTKAARGAFEAILLARSARPALAEFGRFVSTNPRAPYYLLPLEEIDKEEYLQVRIDLLTNKTRFTLNHYTDALQVALQAEFSPDNRRRLPRAVAYAYDHLGTIDNNETGGIISAANTLIEVTTGMFNIAGYDYEKVLGYEPSARQMVDLVGNSYATYAHILAARHTETPINIEKLKYGEDVAIDISDPQKHVIRLINPGQYIRMEEELRRKGEIKSQTIHCPFSISSVFTEPFLDSDVDPVQGNPLKYTFETLVREYIGS